MDWGAIFLEAIGGYQMALCLIALKTGKLKTPGGSSGISFIRDREERPVDFWVGWMIWTLLSAFFMWGGVVMYGHHH
jgi:hypothetical protein